MRNPIIDNGKGSKYPKYITRLYPTRCFSRVIAVRQKSFNKKRYGLVLDSLIASKNLAYTG